MMVLPSRPPASGFLWVSPVPKSQRGFRHHPHGQQLHPDHQGHHLGPVCQRHRPQVSLIPRRRHGSKREVKPLVKIMEEIFY